MALPHAGSWSLGGFKLPDFGITESLAKMASNNNEQTDLSQALTQPRLANTTFISPEGSQQSFQTQNDYRPQDNMSSNTGGSTGGSSGGSSGGSLSDPGQGNPSDSWTDPYRDTYQQEQEVIRGLSDAEISRLETDAAAAGNSRDRLLQEVTDQQGRLLSTVNKQKQEASDRAAEEIAEGADTVKNTQGNIRNMLRALGILASSKAGELLSEPVNEFSRQKSFINRALTKRVGELDDYFNDATLELGKERNRIMGDYEQLINGIRADIRFTESERDQALLQAQQAFNDRLMGIKEAFFNLQSTMTNELSSLAQYVDPTINQQAITNTNQVQQQNQSTRQQASIYDLQREKELDPKTIFNI